MPQVTLTPNQQTSIKNHLHAFSAYVKSDAFRADQAERLARVRFFQKELPKKVNELSEADVDELVIKLWASRMWGNKQYLVQQVIADNGIDKLRDEFRQLLDTHKSVSQRYDRFAKAVSRLGGPASLTEMLCYIQPQECGIWNQISRTAIKILGLTEYVNPEKYRLTAEEYQNFNSVLRAIAEQLKIANFKDVDLLFVDFFLYQVAVNTPDQVPAVAASEHFDHDEVRDLIQNIGVMLGFDAETEVQVAHGARVDTVWRARIGNLGLVTYAFEVQKAGSTDSLLLNLQKSKSSPTVQKVIAVSDENLLNKIRKEAEGLPEEFRRALGFWRVSDVQKVSQNLQSAIDVINSLGLIHSTF